MARILLADENELVVDLMRIFLSEEGHDLEVADDAESLWAHIGDDRPAPDVVVFSADLEPGFSAETIAQLREATGRADLPIVLTVPPAAPDVDDDVAGLRGVELLRKPFDRGSFLARIRTILLLRGPSGRPARRTPPAVPTVSAAPGEAAKGGASLDSAPQPAPAPSPALDDEALEGAVAAWLEVRGPTLVQAAVAEAISRAVAEAIGPTLKDLLGPALREELEGQAGEQLRELSWKVVPELAESLIRAEIKKITEEPPS